MTGRWTAFTTLCIALLLLLPAAAGGATVDGTTLRVSTSSAGNAAVQAAMDAPAAAGPPAWTGLLVLAFGGLIAGLWLGAVALAALRGLAGAGRTLPEGMDPPSNRNRRDETPPADWA